MSHINRLQERPSIFTSELRAEIAEQRRYTDNELATFGIDSVRFGLEMECSISKDPNTLLSKEEIDGYTHDLREAVLADVKSKHGEHSSEYTEAQGFIAQDLMMYALHDMDDRTQPHLEYLFGTGTDEKGYYDAKLKDKRIAELKLKPAPSELLATNAARITNLVQLYAAKLGLKLLRTPSLHINVSFWRGKENLFDPTHPEYTTTGAYIMDGIRDALRNSEMAVTFRSPYDSASCGVGPDRQNNLRITGTGEQARLEIRCEPHSMPTIEELPLIMEGVIKSGAIAGLQRQSHALTPALRGIFDREDSSFKITHHVLEGSHLAEAEIPGTYKLVVPRDYITGFSLIPAWRSIGNELGLQTLAFPLDDMIDENGFWRMEVGIRETDTVEKLNRWKQEFSQGDNSIFGLEFNPIQHAFFDKAIINGNEVSWRDEDITEFLHARKEYCAKRFISDDAIVQLFEEIRLKPSSSGYEIQWPDTKELLGERYPLHAEHMQSCLTHVTCSSIVPTFLHTPDRPVETQSIIQDPLFNGTRTPTFAAALEKAVTNALSPER